MAEKTKEKIEDKPIRKKRANRSEELSVPTGFVNGYADGWFMAVPHCFHSALDIELTSIMRKRPKPEKSYEEMVWTEGRPPIYNFKSGDIFYKTPSAYQGEWGNAVSKISVALQVADALPDQLDGKGAKTHGSLVALVLRKKSGGGGLELVDRHKMTQSEFVNVLKTGLLPNGAKL